MEKKLLFKYILDRTHISAQEFDEIAQQFEILTIKKKTELIFEGEYNHKTYFVQKGLLYSYKTTDDGSTQVMQFAKEGNWISDLYSFFSASKALFSVQSLEDCELLFITKDKFDFICKNHPTMERFFRIQFQEAYVSTLQRLSDAYIEDAETKYSRFVTHHNQLIQRVPQYLIASYLGILPSSLSRIRNKKKKK